jgi:hypothetical protein
VLIYYALSGLGCHDLQQTGLLLVKRYKNNLNFCIFVAEFILNEKGS